MVLPHIFIHCPIPVPVKIHMFETLQQQARRGIYAPAKTGAAAAAADILLASNPFFPGDCVNVVFFSFAPSNDKRYIRSRFVATGTVNQPKTTSVSTEFPPNPLKSLLNL